MEPTRNVLLMMVLATCAAGAQSGPITSPEQRREAFLKLIDRPRVDPMPEVRQMTATACVWSRNTSLLLKSYRPTDAGSTESDGRYHGERAGNPPGLETPYTTAIFNAYKTGREHPFFYDTVLDVMRLIDYLETRPDVDPSRIGLGGTSKGGIETYLTAAVDRRVAVAVSERGVQGFKWALDHGAWDSRAWTIRDALEATADESKAIITAAFVRQFYDRVAPGIYGDFDAPAMLPLVAPRPLLVINGDSDPRTPMAGVRESAAAAERAYSAAGASDKFALRVMPNVGHENTPEIEHEMFEWFTRWLKP